MFLKVHILRKIAFIDLATFSSFMRKPGNNLVSVLSPSFAFDPIAVRLRRVSYFVSERKPRGFCIYANVARLKSSFSWSTSARASLIGVSNVCLEALSKGKVWMCPRSILGAFFKLRHAVNMKITWALLGVIAVVSAFAPQPSFQRESALEAVSRRGLIECVLLDPAQVNCDID